MDGTELAIRFSSVTNQLQFCGPQAAQKQFHAYMATKAGGAEVREALQRFEGLYPYLKAIADKHGKDFLDEDVVEAYWIGNELLDAFSKEDMAGIISFLTKRGLPVSIADGLIKGLPEGFVPHHDFNVLFVGVGKTTGSVPTNIQNMDNCRVGWGTVKGFQRDNLIVETEPLQFRNGTYLLGNSETKTIVYEPDWFPGIKAGDIIALHWGMACVVLGEKQLASLKKYTKKILDVMNRP